MLLADIGNTDTVFSFGNPFPLFRIKTTLKATEAFYTYHLKQFILENDIPKETFQTAAYSSVVPQINLAFEKAIQNLNGQTPYGVKPGDFLKVQVKIDRAHELGTDIYCSCVAAYIDCHQTCIVVDFGTAFTCTAINSNGEILGVAIAPGLKTAVKSLFKGTAQLPEVPLELPEKAIGTNTVSAIQSGVLFGYEGLVKNIVQKFTKELGSEAKVYATGGLSHILPDLQGIFYKTDVELTLKGIEMVAKDYFKRNTLSVQ